MIRSRKGEVVCVDGGSVAVGCTATGDRLICEYVYVSISGGEG